MIGQLDWDGIVLPMNDVTWPNVLSTANRLQGMDLTSDFFVTYKDEEGDVINVKNDMDLNEAIRWAQEHNVPCLCLHVPFSSAESDSDESWTEIDNGSPRGVPRVSEQVEEIGKPLILAEDANAVEQGDDVPTEEETPAVVESPQVTEPDQEEMPPLTEGPSDTVEPSAVEPSAVEPSAVEPSTVDEVKDEDSSSQEESSDDEITDPELYGCSDPEEEEDAAEDLYVEDAPVSQTVTPIAAVFEAAVSESARPPPVVAQETSSARIDKIIEIMCSVNDCYVAEPDDEQFFRELLCEPAHVEKFVAFLSHPAVQLAVSQVASAEKTSRGSAQKAATTQLIKVLYRNPEVLVELNAIPKVNEVLLRVLRALKKNNVVATHEEEEEATAPVEVVVQDEVEDIKPKVVHTLISCDGCNTDADLKTEAIVKGSRNSSGEILGVRYKSAVLPDFDLCEVCESSGRFQAEGGPFLKIMDPASAPDVILCAMPGTTAGMVNQLDSLDWRNPIAREFLEFVRQRQQRAFPRQPRVDRSAPPTVGWASAHFPAVPTHVPSVPSVPTPVPAVPVAEEPVGKNDFRCKHLLKTFNAPHGAFTCDVCQLTQPIFSVLHGCRVCNFDVCHKCFTEKDLGLKLEPPVVVSLAPPQAKFVSDVTLADGCAVRAGESLVKAWRVRNSGPERWPVGTRIAHVGGDAFGGPVNGVEVPLAAPGEAVNVTVPLVMPNQPGRYTSYWRLMTPHPDNFKFGHRFWVTVNVLPATASLAPLPPPQIVRPAGSPVMLAGSPPVLEPPTSQRAPPVPPRQPVTPTAFEETVARIADFGFTDVEKIVTILGQVNGDAAAAIERLLDEA